MIIVAVFNQGPLECQFEHFVSLFETYMLVLASGLQAHTSLRVKDVKGQGVTRLLAFLRRIGVMPDRVHTT